jgi:hypothetical protein
MLRRPQTNDPNSSGTDAKRQNRRLFPSSSYFGGRKPLREEEHAANSDRALHRWSNPSAEASGSLIPKFIVLRLIQWVSCGALRAPI